MFEFSRFIQSSYQILYICFFNSTREQGILAYEYLN